MTTWAVTLTDGTTIRPRDDRHLHSVVQHLTCGGQDRVGFTLTDESGRDVDILIGDVQRFEVAR